MTIYIVSGLPRSGTSMMMLMLKEGGIDLCYDDSLKPNEANPNGVFELRGVVQNFGKVHDGQAIKVVSGVLNRIPTGDYKIIYMKRKSDEVIESQRKLMRKNNNPDAEEASGWFIYQQKKTIKNAFEFIENNKVPYIIVDYNKLMENDDIVDNIVEFLNIPLDSQLMKQVIDKSLYRNRI